MKTERITVLGSTEFKSFLALEASREEISISELVRRRCEQKPGEDEELLAVLASELQRAVKSAKASLIEGITAVNAALEEVQRLRVSD